MTDAGTLRHRLRGDIERSGYYPDLVADPWHIADAVPGALSDLMAASGLGPPTPVEDAFGMTAGSRR